MEPTLTSGDWLLAIEVLPLGLRSVLSGVLLKRGAIVLVRPPAHQGRLEVKRLSGLPGDRRYWAVDSSLYAELQRVPRAHLFVTSDCQSHMGPGLPADSRRYGPLPRAAAVARVVAIVWPPRRLSLVTGWCRTAPLEREQIDTSGPGEERLVA
jgi:type IV secretory pathway protease TraF